MSVFRVSDHALSTPLNDDRSLTNHSVGGRLPANHNAPCCYVIDDEDEMSITSSTLASPVFVRLTQ